MRILSVVLVLVSLLAYGCGNGGQSLPTAPSSPSAPRQIVIGATIRTLLSDADTLCDPNYPPTRCTRYLVTVPRNGSLEVAVTWIDDALDADAIGFSVIDPTGRHWYPPQVGTSRSVRLPAARDDFFRINIWSMPGEEFTVHTLIN